MTDLASPIIKRRTRAGSFEQFAKRYRPIEMDDGSLMRDWQEIPLGTDERCVWTIVEGDNNRLYLTPGYHYVNRLGYAVCEVPFPDIEDELPGYVY